MGIVYIENFTAWASIASSTSEVDAMTNLASQLSITPGNRAASSCMQADYVWTGGRAWYHKNLLRTASTMWVTWRSSCDVATTTSTCVSLFRLEETSTQHVIIGYTNNYELCAYNHNKTVLYGKGPVLTQGAWHQFVAKVFISDTVGTIEVRMDGIATPIINLTGLDTRNGGAGNISRIAVGETINVANISPLATTTRIMDLAVWDNDGNSPSGWVGDVRVDDYTPSGDGSSTQWTPLSSTNYSQVDEAAADYDTTYVYTSTNAQIDLYAMNNMTHNPPNIYSVSPNAVAKKIDAGTAQLKLKMVNGATTSTGAAETLTMGTYIRYIMHFGANPDTATAWTVADVDAAEGGFESVL